MYIAHTKNQRGQRHDLVQHLRDVAQRASENAEEFGAGDLAHFIGLWHDIGKFNPAFQEYLLRCEADPKAKGHGPDHKAAGTGLALKDLGLPALLIQGHHGGLHSPTELRTWLYERSRDGAAEGALQLARATLPDLEPASKVPIPTHIETDWSASELFLRLLFSALVDADYLDTELHFTREKGEQRGSTASIAELWERFAANQADMDGMRDDEVGRTRHAIYQSCLEAAEQPPGLFRLTVPTGGGKTRSGMAFALRHALRHGHKRVIVAVPFISITEQTADTYRHIFNPNPESGAEPVVLEHHSGGYDEHDPEGDFHPSKVWSRLAAENWDAPVVVTTTVQLFESLFANGTSRCRKLHRLANSVIILDEAQALPSYLLEPILDVLGQLCRHYGTTVVISTATQPAFDAIPIFRDTPSTEIVPEPGRFFDLLKRVNYEWRIDAAVAWTEVAEAMRAEKQGLCIVNTKKDALALLDALEDPRALHLSTLLCGAHRRKVIGEVKSRLANGEPCRLVSTQVIEAGVDVDFPFVMRALGPLDGIIQAAGRCNREGRLAEKGRVVIFRPEGGGMPQGAYKTGAGITRALLTDTEFDPDNPAHSRRYFQELFPLVDTDRQKVQDARKILNYPEVSRRFKMIEGETESVIVSYGSQEEQRAVDGMIARLEQGAPEARLLLRRLQPYIVSLRVEQARKYGVSGLIQQIMPGVGRWLGKYHPVWGLTGEDLDPDQLVV